MVGGSYAPEIEASCLSFPTDQRLEEPKAVPGSARWRRALPSHQAAATGPTRHCLRSAQARAVRIIIARHHLQELGYLGAHRIGIPCDVIGTRGHHAARRIGALRDRRYVLHRLGCFLRHGGDSQHAGGDLTGCRGLLFDCRRDRCRYLVATATNAQIADFICNHMTQRMLPLLAIVC